jgi:hemerythrin-like metal-binding protein
MSLDENQLSITLGNAVIDEDHLAFINLLQQLAAAGNAEFPALFQELYAHTEQHFAREQELMQQSAFPAQSEHSGEHQRVLNEFKQFKTRIDKGLISFGRAFAKDRLPQWFELHIATMDSVLVTHLKARTEGGV